VAAAGAFGARTVIAGLAFDGAARDPLQQAARDALLGFIAATAQAQAEATTEAEPAGGAAAKPRQPRSYHGRKASFDRERAAMVRDMLVSGSSISAIAAATGLSRRAIYKIRSDPAWSEDRLAAWVD
jgi:DNA invertase Pin-like site-specific DNA recombinase